MKLLCKIFGHRMGPFKNVELKCMRCGWIRGVGLISKKQFKAAVQRINQYWEAKGYE